MWTENTSEEKQGVTRNRNKIVFYGVYNVSVIIQTIWTGGLLALEESTSHQCSSSWNNKHLVHISDSCCGRSIAAVRAGGETL